MVVHDPYGPPGGGHIGHQRVTPPQGWRSWQGKSSEYTPEAEDAAASSPGGPRPHRGTGEGRAGPAGNMEVVGAVAPTPESRRRRVVPCTCRARSRAQHRRGAPLQPPPDHPRRGDGRAEAAEERQGARHRRRRPGLARPALPGRGRRRHARDRGVRRGRRVQPPAPDHPRHVRHRPPQGRVRQGVDRRGQPLRRGRRAQRAPRQRQRAAGLRGLRPHRRRHRQLRDPLHGQRRGLLPEDPLRLGLDLPLRRPGVRLRADPRPTTPRATAASTPSPRRRAWSPAAPRAACSACCAPASARSRSTRRSS